MAIKKYNYTPPKLHDHKADLKKRWFVSYKALDQRTGRPAWFRYYVPSRPTAPERYAAAGQIIAQLKKLLSQSRGIVYGAQIPAAPKVRTFENISAMIDTLAAERLARPLAQKTASSYRSIYETFRAWIHQNHYEHLPPDRFNATAAHQFMVYLDQQGKSARTWNNYRNAIGSLFKAAVNEQIIGVNPFAGISKRRAPMERNMPMPVNIRDRVAAYLKETDPRLWAVCAMVYYAYLRPGEVLKLRVHQIRLNEGVIYLEGAQAKNKRYAAVSIPPGLYKVLAALKLDYEYPKDYLFGRDLQTGPDPLHPNRLYERYRGVRIRLGLPDQYTLYCWKATGVRDAVKAGIDIDQIQRHLRHTDLRMVQIYLKNIGALADRDLLDKYPEI